MLEIASEIIICLLLAALIGFAIGYLFAKSKSEKSTPDTNTDANNETKIETKSMGEETPEKEALDIESSSQTTPDMEDTTEEVEIPTENVIEEALEALESLEEIPEEEIAKENEIFGQKPELLSEPRNGEKDKLTKIKGIGPKVEEKLNASGIYHFEQIANWTEANMLWLEAHTLFASRAKKELWIEESKSFLE